MHSKSKVAGYNAGFKIVRDMINDKAFKAYIDKGLNEKIIKTINLDENERKYLQTVLLKGLTIRLSTISCLT